MKGSVEKIRIQIEMFRRLFDRSPAQVALLDFSGAILQTNLAWKKFGRENGLTDSYEGVGKNYLQICEAAWTAGDPDAQQAYVGLLEVMHLKRSKFTMIYPCHSPAERRWFRMWVEPQTPEMPTIIVAHYLRETKPVVEYFGQSTVLLGHGEDSRYDARF